MLTTARKKSVATCAAGMPSGHSRASVRIMRGIPHQMPGKNQQSKTSVTTSLIYKGRSSINQDIKDQYSGAAFPSWRSKYPPRCPSRHRERSRLSSIQNRR